MEGVEGVEGCKTWVVPAIETFPLKDLVVAGQSSVIFLQRQVFLCLNFLNGVGGIGC